MSIAKAAPSRRSPPPASLKKRLIHTFYLVQPLIQFFALVAIIGIFSRCSPLSPSTDKSIGLKNKTGTTQTENNLSTSAENIAREEMISQNMKEISVSTLEISNDTSFEKKTSGTVAQEGERLEESLLKSRLLTRFENSHGETQKRRKLLSLRLSGAQTTQLVMDGMVRIDLSQTINSNESGKKLLFKVMQDSLAEKKLDASSHLIFSNETMRDAHAEINHALRLKILASIPWENQAFLEIRIDAPSPESRADAVATLDEALQDAAKLAIVIE